jgi:hypothetical protein
LTTSHKAGGKRLVGFLKHNLLGAGLFMLCIGVQAQGLGISADGLPSYSVPIAVPPGIGGMVPNIALQYGASGVNGPVGYGWNVQGVSLITRCVGNKRLDGVARGVEFGGNDKLCLDGQRLILTDASGNPLANQQGDSLGGSGMVHEYRTEKDSFARIRAYGSNGDASNGPAYFKVWTKSGQIYEYGNGSGSQINVTGKGVLTAWAVSRISDTVGNYIDFRYEQRDVAWGSNATAGHEWRIKEILYTGTATQQAVNRVVFDYTERTDKPGAAQDRAESYHQGGKNISIWLLDRVSTYINWPADQPSKPAAAVHVKSLKLDYDNGPLTARNRLVKLRECVDFNLGKCLPATTFAYAAGADVNYTPNPTFRTSELSTLVMTSQTGNYGVLTGDFFGNGRTSILRWSDVPSENRLFRSDGNGNFTSIPNGTGGGQFNLIGENLFKSDSCFTSVAADFNGDGLTDIFRKRGTTTSGCGTVRNILYLSNGDGSFRMSPITGLDIELWEVRSDERDEYYCPATKDPDFCQQDGAYLGTSRSFGSTHYLIDVNNDGLLDIVTTIRPSYTTTMNPPSDAELCATRLCSRVFLGQTNGTFVELLSTNLAHVSVYGSPPYNIYASPSSYTSDVNGDGLTDFVVESGIWLSRGDGNFDFDPAHQAVPACQFPLDFNGDGRADCIFPAAIGIYQGLKVADGTHTQRLVGNFNLNYAAAGLADSDIYGRQLTGMQVADFNGDGRSDILHWKDDPAKNIIYLSNGDGTFRTSLFNLTTANDQLQKSDGSARFVLGNFSGRGTTEILRLKASPSASSEGTVNQLYAKSDAMPPDQLMSVKSGSGITTSLTWVTLTNSNSGSFGARYKSDRGTADAAVYPTVDVVASTNVVATLTDNSGPSGALQRTEYAYAGMKMTYDGRGLLGFRSVLQQKTAPNGESLTVATQSVQNGNNPGAKSMTETRRGALDQPGAQLLSRTTLIYCDKTAAAGAEAAANATAPCETNAKVQRPYLYRATEQGWDLDGVELPTVVTTNTFSNNGDPIDIVTVSTASQAQSSKHTVNEYEPVNISGDSWILGRLKKTTVFSDTSNSSLPMPTVPGKNPVTPPPVTAPPINPATLMSIIMLILGDD